MKNYQIHFYSIFGKISNYLTLLFNNNKIKLFKNNLICLKIVYNEKVKNIFWKNIN